MFRGEGRDTYGTCLPLCLPKPQMMVPYTMLHHVLFYKLNIKFRATRFHPLKSTTFFLKSDVFMT